MNKKKGRRGPEGFKRQLERPLAFNVVAAKLIKRKGEGRETTRTDELRKLFGYGEEAPGARVRRRHADFNVYLKERGYVMASTTHLGVYPIKDVKGRRKKCGG